MSEINHLNSKSGKSTAIVLSMGIILVVLAVAYYVHQSQKEVLKQILKGQAGRIEFKLIDNTQHLLLDLDSISQRWNSLDNSLSLQRKLDGQDFLKRTKGVGLLLKIDSKFNIEWSEPEAPGLKDKLEGILEESEVVLKLIQARDNNRAEISKTFEINNKKVVFIFRSIGKNESFSGFVAIKVDVNEFISNILGDPSSVGFYTKAYSNKEVVFANGPELKNYSDLEYFQLNLDEDDDGWLFKVYPTNDSLNLIISPLPYFIVIAGSLIAFLFFLTLRSKQRATKESYKLASEISEREKVQFELEYLANHDTLTHLPNRHYITNFIESRVKHSKNSKQKFTILFIDLDHFKDINDTLGHAVGDEMLKKLPILFNRVFRHDDVIARMGGDEFIVYLPGEMTIEHVENLVARFLKSLEYPIEIGEHLIRLTGSVGVAFYPDHGSDVNELLSHADAALYRAKDEGRNTFAIYDSEIEQKAKDRVNLIAKLHSAYENDEFEMYYQPRYQLSTNKIIGSEALMRWNTPEGEIIMPNMFIDLLEETSLIIPVALKLLRRSCVQFSKLLEKQPHLFMSFNISAKQLEHPDFVMNLQKILAETEFPANKLEIELTEQTLIQNVENSRFILDKLKEMGIAIAIDDFGTGYSSLSYLKNFQVDILKIDKSFIKDIDTDNDDFELVKTMIAMGKNLNITTVAEGVENEMQLKLLTEESCDQVQGYYYKKAMRFYDFYQLVE